MTFRIPLALFSLVIAASPLGAQYGPECRDDFRGSRAARKAHADSVGEVRASIRLAMAEEIRAAARASGVPQPEGLVVISADAALRPTIMHAGLNFAPDLLRDVGSRLLARAALLPRPGVECYAMVLRIDSLPTAPAAPGDSAEVEPVLQNPRELRLLLERWIDANSGVGRRTAMVSLIVTRDGGTILPRIRESSGSVAFDSFALFLMGEARFSVATEGGVPRDVLVYLPLTAIAPPPEGQGSPTPRFPPRP
ncbi:MAG TPA: hypothetical protein VE913_21225 [Longimicrobium sp.]|nr:hypothetical protein [Longimicrobium sp.]